MAKYASGKRAYGISARSGFRYRYRDLRKEWNGAVVGFDEFEPKHPQLFPVRKVFDAQALRDARPQPIDTQSTFEVKTTNGIVSLGNGNFATYGVAELPSKIEITDALVSSVGTVTVTT